ncbi:amidohydrolase family protein [bacterium]|nr:amidohydrolase family protein [bacterium]
MNKSNMRLLGTAIFAFLIAIPAQLIGQDKSKEKEKWDVTEPRGETREISFSTDEGTWMTLDISPDNKWLYFDLMGHIYRISADGGKAENLTDSSGIALNFHPAISPDGSQIAFISDRSGQSNLWIMDADGSNPKQVFKEGMVRAVTPEWTNDGEYILVRRQSLSGGGSGIWMYHKDGGQGIEVANGSWPSVSDVDSYLYYYEAVGPRQGVGMNDALKGYNQLRRKDLKTGDVIEITNGVAGQQIRSSSGGGYAGEVSPDGRYLAFARQIPSGTINYRGHEFGPRTALWLRDLHTGSERIIMDPIDIDMTETIKALRVLPGYSWSSDSKHIFISQGGKIRKLDVKSGQVETIPFEADIHRTISEQAYHKFEVPFDEFKARFLRWYALSPDGKKAAFQAIGRIWVMEVPNGTPKRLTKDFESFEFAPSWSPDSKFIAFSSWHDTDGGELWKAEVRNSRLTKLTKEPGEYLHPNWSEDGSKIVAIKGSGTTNRGRTWAWNPWYDVVEVNSKGSDARQIIRIETGGGSRSQLARPFYGPENRIFFQEPEDGNYALKSVRKDGSDEIVHVSIEDGDEIMLSPDGNHVAITEGMNVYLMPLPYLRTNNESININKKNGKFPVKQLSKTGGFFPTWISENEVTFGSADRMYKYDLVSEKTDSISINLTVKKEKASGSIAMTNARIITVNENDDVIESGSIVAVDGRITCVGDCDTSGVDEVIDASGKTIMPGLIDMHAHHYREYRGIMPKKNFETAIYLAFGVTTNLDNSMWSHNVFPTAELIDAGEILGPRTFSTGDPLYRGDGTNQNELSSYEVAEENIERLKSFGAVSLKQYLQPRRDQRQWVTDIARREGLMVTTEGSDLMYNLGLTLDGHTAFEHPMSYGIIYKDASMFFGKAKMVYSPTFMVGGMGPWNEEYYYQREDVWKNEKMQRFLPWRQLLPHTRRRMLRPESDYGFPLIAESLKDVIEAGGYGAIGSHGQIHGISSHWELWMTAAGMSNLQAIRVATYHGAYFLGMQDDLGSLEEGKIADLLVINSNPLDDIENTLDMMYVMKDGKLYEAATLNEVWPEKKKYGPYYWVDEDALKSDSIPMDYWDRNK